MVGDGGTSRGVNQGYGTLIREHGDFPSPFVRNPLKAYGAGRITAVLSVSQSDGTFLMTSQDLDNPERVPDANFFFSSVTGIDSLLIGGSDTSSSGYLWEMNGTIYFVEIYDVPFTEAQAEAKIRETYPSVSLLTSNLGVSYVRTGDRTFQFDVQLADGFTASTYDWEFPGGGTSSVKSPSWTAPDGGSNPFVGIPRKVTVTVTVTSNGYLLQGLTKAFYISPDAGSGHIGRSSYFENMVFRHGDDGFACFRIPAMIRAGNGDLLAFAEARPICHDTATGIKIVLKRSVDNGATWGPMKIIAENTLPNGEHPSGAYQVQNVTAVLDVTDPDYPDGKIVIVYNATEYGYVANRAGNGVRRAITAWSGDHGHTWNWDQIDSPAGTYDGDITNQVHYPNNPSYTAVYDADYARANYSSSRDWRFVQPTLGHSIQLEHGTSETNGRLFITGSYSLHDSLIPGGNTYRYWGQNYVYWSADHGKTWEIGDILYLDDHLSNEATAVELENGNILLSIRGYNSRGSKLRGRLHVLGTFDADGDISFGDPYVETDLTTQDIAVGLARVTTSDQTIFGSKSRIAFTAPNDGPGGSHSRRKGLSLWMSDDEGTNWELLKLLYDIESGYSDIVVLPDTRIGVIYEGGYKSSHAADHRGLMFISASLHRLSDGADQRALVRHDASITLFEGSSGFDLSSSIGDVENLTEGSMVVTFKTDGVAGGQTLFSVSNHNDADSMWSLVQTGDGRFGVYARNDSTDVNLTYFDRDLVTDGLWHRMAVTVGSDGTDVYVDGQHVAHTESTGFFADVDGLTGVDLGRVFTSDGVTGYWNGSIGTVEVFDGVLTAEQAVAATQPAAMPVAAFHVDRDLTADNAITLGDEPGGTDLVADHLPQWVCNELAASWAIGTTFTAPDSVTDQATVFHSEDSVPLGDGSQLSIASLMLGIWDTTDGKRIGLRYHSPVTSEWDLSVPFDVYSGQKVSMIAVMGPVNSYLIINGQTVATTPTPVPEGPHTWHPANTTIGTTNTDHTLDTNLKTLAIWKGAVPSTPLAQSLTLAHNITR